MQFIQHGLCLAGDARQRRRVRLDDRAVERVVQPAPRPDVVLAQRAARQYALAVGEAASAAGRVWARRKFKKATARPLNTESVRVRRRGLPVVFILFVIRTTR